MPDKRHQVSNREPFERNSLTSNSVAAWTLDKVTYNVLTCNRDKLYKSNFSFVCHWQI